MFVSVFFTAVVTVTVLMLVTRLPEPYAMLCSKSPAAALRTVKLEVRCPGGLTSYVPRVWGLALPLAPLGLVAPCPTPYLVYTTMSGNIETVWLVILMPKWYSHFGTES